MITSAASLSEIALSVGFSDQAHLCRLFRRAIGQSPANWRRERGIPDEVTSRTAWTRISHERSARQSAEPRPFRTLDRKQTSDKWRKGRTARARAIDLLIVLVEQANKVVGRRTLIERVWPKRAAEQVSLRVHISALRKALDQSDPGKRRWY